MTSDAPVLLTEQDYLASALRLLIDAAWVRDGTRIGFAEVSRHLHDVKLSRSRWNYIMNGQRLVTDPSVRQALADYFGVQPHHLTREGRAELLGPLQTDLPAILRHRLEKVRAFAERQAAGVDSPAIDYAIAYLDSLLGDEGSGIEDLLNVVTHAAGSG
ncbi:hypothetical protein ACPW96_18195 [Micromonospora sp. DT81.3]|uniref:hypothetical protein n=1 Tax=Micromonospora sp. DT81.3 TaxID=3416523 RepID=UPI003CEFAE85